MAEDSREHALPTATATAKYNRSQKTDSHAKPARPESANLLSGGTINTAGGRINEATFVDGLKSIHLSDLKELHTKPCVRESLLVGIGAGFGIGGARAILGAPILLSCNWAVGSFVACSFLMHEYCQRKRIVEKQGIKRAVEILERKKAERRLQEADAREARRNTTQEKDGKTKT